MSKKTMVLAIGTGLVLGAIIGNFVRFKDIDSFTAFYIPTVILIVLSIIFDNKLVRFEYKLRRLFIKRKQSKRGK